MKLKKLLSVVGLGLFAMTSVGAGVALAKAPDAKAAKADDELWMFRVQFDAREMDTWGDPCSNYCFHCWGDGWFNTYSLQFMNGASSNKGRNVYATNIVLPTSKSVTGAKFICTQNDDYKESKDLSFTIDSSATELVREWYYTSWTEAKWDATARPAETAPVFFNETKSTSQSFVANPEMARFECKNVAIGDDYIHFDLIDNYSISVLTATTLEDFGTNGSDYLATCWYKLNSTGTFNFYLYGESEGNGQMVVQKEGGKSTSYMYYISGEDGESENYIYTHGGVKQFGNWPGTHVTDIVGVVDVTKDHILHFQDNMHRVYRIPVVVGCDGDSLVIVNHPGSSAESASKSIMLGGAFTWNDDFDFVKGLALELLYSIETVRNSVAADPEKGIKQYSICGITKTQAEGFVSSYNDAALGATGRALVDSSTVLTYKRNGEAGSEMVSYHYVMEELAAIAKMNLEGSTPRPTTILNETIAENGAMIAVVAVIAIVSLSSLAVLLVIKKRKHE